MNVGRYVWNNPLNWNDPSGLAAGISYAGQSRSSQAAIAGGSGVRRFTSGLQTARALARPRALQGATRVAGQLACQLFGAASAIDVLGVVDWTVCGAQAAIANESTESETQTETKASEASDADDSECADGNPLSEHDRKVNIRSSHTNHFGGCSGNLSEDQMIRNRKHILREIDARKKRREQCYGGINDKGHQERDDKLEKMLKKCNRKLGLE